MQDIKDLFSDFLNFQYDESDKPFDYIGTDTETALLCITDQEIREKIQEALKNHDYFISEVETAKDAVKKMRFHVYTLLVIDEGFDTTNPETNDLVRYLATFPMSTRRRMFVVLLSNHHRTLDRMTTLNRSVNMIINKQNLKDFMTLVNNGKAENEGFYFTLTEALKASKKI